MSTSIDQQFIEYIVKSLVGKPDAVKIDRRIDEKGVLLELTVDPEDLGRVIGKRGATAQSLRTLLRALGTKNEARYNLKIVDNGAPRPERSEMPMQDESRRSDDTTQEEWSAEPAVDESAASAPAQPADDSTTVVDDDDMADLDDSDDEERSSDKLNRTREELKDLDDLDLDD
jgi:uncharacterized protein